MIVDLILPARNNAATIGAALSGVPSRLVRLSVVVDCGSDDATARVASDAGAVVLRARGAGYGQACMRAVRYLSGLPTRPGAVVFMAPDGSDPPQYISHLLGPIAQDNAELVLASRSGTREPRALTTVARGLMRVIYRHDYSSLCPFRAIRFPALVAMAMSDPAAGFHVEMQVKAAKLGLHIVEVPIDGSSHGLSSGAMSDTIKTTGRVLYQIFRHATAR